MTGPAHFARAEEHLAYAAGTETDGHDDGMSAWHQRQAQAHGLLALAAAVIDTGNGTIKPSDLHEWRQATDEDYAAGCAAEVTR